VIMDVESYAQEMRNLVDFVKTGRKSHIRECEELLKLFDKLNPYRDKQKET